MTFKHTPGSVHIEFDIVVNDPKDAIATAEAHASAYFEPEPDDRIMVELSRGYVHTATSTMARPTWEFRVQAAWWPCAMMD